MIRHTFSLLQGIGEKLERRLWREGVLTWDDFLNSGVPGFISGERKALYDGVIADAAEHLLRNDAAYFVDALSSGQQWRLYDSFGQNAICLDIETNGLSAAQGGKVTVVGLYDGREYRALLRGENLSAARLMQEISGYTYLITFFGSVFDIPFLYHALPGFRMKVPHFDLCMGGKKVGLSGGLKKIERELAIERGSDTQGLSGYDAVLLWRRAKSGDSDALDLLVKYNREDTVNLMRIADVLYARLRAATGIEEYLGQGHA